MSRTALLRNTKQSLVCARELAESMEAAEVAKREADPSQEESEAAPLQSASGSKLSGQCSFHLGVFSGLLVCSVQCLSVICPA